MPENGLRARSGPDRRAFVSGAVAAGIGLASGRFAPAQADTPSLAALAAQGGRFFGAAVEGSRLDADPALADLVAGECACLVPEWTMKWAYLEPEPGRFNFADFDRTAGFAADIGLWLRGHTLLWHDTVPDWAAAELTRAADWDRVVAPFLDTMAGRYGARVRHWDVVNEAIDGDDHRADGLRASPLARLLGDDFIRLAYQRVHAAAPGARLFYNDYGYSYEARWMVEKRRLTLAALERWLAAGAPIHGFGIQSHLFIRDAAFDPRAFRTFLADIADLGLEIVVSELDVREADLDAPVAARDRAVADEAARYLEVVLDEAAVSGVVTWGLANRYSWLHDFHDPRNRGLPYDTDLRPTPMRDALAAAFADAPARVTEGNG